MLDTGAWPNPNQAGSGAFGLSRNFQCLGRQGNSGARRDQIDGKFNWNPNSKLSTYVRVGYNNGDWYNPVIFGLLGGPVVSPTNISAGVGAAKVWNNTVSASYIFSPVLLLDAFFGYSRIDMYSKQPNQEQNLGYTLLKIPGLDTSGLSPRKRLEYGGLPLMTIDAFTSLGPANTFQPQEYHDPDATANANLSARLPYLFATCRFAHYLKCIVRDKIGSFKEREDMERWLNKCIMNYVTADPKASEEVKSQYPLAAAEVTVEEVAGNPGYYTSKFFLRPHFQLEGLTVSLRLVTKLPSVKAGAS